MRLASLLSCVLVLAAACEGPGVASAPSPLLERPAAELEVLAERGDRALVVVASSTPLPQTDERAVHRLALRTDQDLVDVPGRHLGGALTAEGVLVVTEGGALVDDSGRVLDQGVIPELAVRADGRAVAYPHHAGAGAGVYVIELPDGAPRLVTGGLAVADRPLFLDDGRLLVVGARTSGIAGVWLLDPDGGAQPVALTNGALRAGRPLGSSFVPPPAYHASMHIEDGVLVYDDGRAERRVALAGGAS